MNWVIPMEPVICPDVKDESGYVHEIKWDGIRGMVYVQDGKVRIYTKKGKEKTGFYPELDVLKKALGGKSVILDGEFVVLGEEGVPSFYKSLIRERVSSSSKLQYYASLYPVCYMVFDILQYEDHILVNIPLIERKQILEENLSSLTGDDTKIFLTKMYQDGKKLFEQMKKQNMEGIVSKKQTACI